MKRCPTCQRVYQGDDLSFCLDDGAPLLAVSSSSYDVSATMPIQAPRPTNQSPAGAYTAGAPAQSPPGRKTSALPWIMGAVILGLSAVVIGLLMMRRGEPADVQTANNQVVNTSPSPEATTSSTTHHREESPAASPEETARPETTGSRDETAPPPPTPRPTTTERPKPSAPVSSGVLNGKATSLPKPAYPPVARAARASGLVTVQVTIDESGKVTTARAISGHPLLQQAAVQAAYGARFSPTLLSGQPVKVTGVITYNFIAQ